MQPELGSLTALTRLAFPTAGVSFILDSISRLTALRELDLTGNAGDISLPAGMTACRQLSRLAVESYGDVREYPVLANLPHLRYLSVTALPGQQQHWTRLTTLMELRLGLIRDKPDVPAGLAGMVGLRKLFIGGMEWGALPAGPYLSALESLVVDAAVSLPERLLAPLAAATQLQSLSFGMRSVELTAFDIAVLSSMPALKTLELRKLSSEKVDAVQWSERLARLTAQCAAHCRVPPVIRDS